MNKKILSLLLLPCFLLVTSSFSHKPVFSRKSLKIMVISDLNSSYGSTTYSKEVEAVIARIDTIKPDIILCGGDMVAGQKAALSDENILQMWSGFKSTVLEPISRLKIPFGFTVGNHDASPSYTRDRAFSEKFWKSEASSTNLNFVDSTHYPFYYSYVKDRVFFTSWDAAGAEVKEEVYEWMKQQLNSREARRANYRIVIGHLPLYAIVDSKNKPGEVNANPEKALRFFKENRVDLYISGHQHAYYPAQKDGVWFLNMGCIGDGPRKLIGHDHPATKSYTLLNVPAKAGAPIVFETFDANARPIGTEALPDSVSGFNGTSYKTSRFSKSRSDLQ